MLGIFGTVSVKEELVDEFVAAVREMARQCCTEEGFLYSDLYRTKHANRFVMIEMYAGRDELMAHQDYEHSRKFAAVRPRYELEKPDFFTIRPVYSDPPARRRPIAPPYDPDRYRYLQEEPQESGMLGVLVNVDIKLDQLESFVTAIDEMGQIVAAGEPGFRYADMYATNTPGHYVMVELYQNKETLWGHQDYQHTVDWPKRKDVYEVSKPKAFTIRPIFSEGPMRRSLVGG